MFPEVSIIIPCYMQAEFLPETLESVLAQNYLNWECIIVNDGSVDNTEEIAVEYCKKDIRFKYLSKENGGIASARNAGIQKSIGKFILPLDADDLISKDYLELGVDILQKNLDIKLVYSKASFFDKRKGEWKLPDYNYHHLLLSGIIFCSAIYRRADFDKISGYNINMKKGWEDWDFWLSFLSEDDKVYQIPKICFFYRIKKESRTKSISDETARELYMQLYHNHKDVYDKYIVPILLFKNYERFYSKNSKMKNIIKDLIREIIRKMRLPFFE